VKRFAALVFLVSCLWSPAAEAATHRYQGLTVEVDDADAYPGGLVAVKLVSRRPLRGIVYGILDGRRCPAFPVPGGMRALVPVPVTLASGRATLGIEIRSGGGRRRYAVPVTIASRAYPPRQVVLPADKRAAAESPDGVRDGRLLLQYLRTVSPRQEWKGPFRPPVEAAPRDSFGAPQVYPGVPAVESLTDAIHGEYHRGLDYDVAAGTPVKAPAAGTVLFSATLALSGRTVVVDHGQGLLSVFSHLATAGVRQGESLVPGRVIGMSGDTGIAAVPHLHWAVYLHGVAIDPRVTERL
jgi:murein DD-endopeptidase MepM/ murein hydrolase activator NlpD